MVAASTSTTSEGLMASTATTRNRFNKQGTGDNSGTWGGVLNSQVFDVLDESLDGVTSLAVSGNVALTSLNYVSDQSRRRILKLTGSPGASYTITVPSVEKFYFVINQSNAAQTIKAGGMGYSVPAGAARAVACDGTDCFGPDSSVPYVIGAVIDFAGTTEPSGWLFCYGQAISRATYAGLFGAIGTTYGTGDGSTTFNLPDLRGRVVAGQDDMGGSSANRLTAPSTAGSINGDTLGAVGGEEAHTPVLGEMFAHNHGGSTGSTNQPLYPNTVTQTADAGSNNNYWGGTQAGGSHSHTISTQGSSTPFNIVQPTMILNKIIYAGI
jgi:microcystin-dependent protein